MDKWSRKNNKERECLDNVFVGRWNNEKMKNKLDYINDESYKKKNTENDEMLLEILKETFSEIDLKKIVEFYNTI